MRTEDDAEAAVEVVAVDRVEDDATKRGDRLGADLEGRLARQRRGVDDAHVLGRGVGQRRLGRDRVVPRVDDDVGDEDASRRDDVEPVGPAEDAEARQRRVGHVRQHDRPVARAEPGPSKDGWMYVHQGVVRSLGDDASGWWSLAALFMHLEEDPKEEEDPG